MPGFGCQRSGPSGRRPRWPRAASRSLPRRSAPEPSAGRRRGTCPAPPDADAGRRAVGEDRRRIRPRRGQRLLGVDVLAGGDRRPRDGRVRDRRREDEDDLDRRVGQELLQGDGREARRAPTSAAARSASRSAQAASSIDGNGAHARQVQVRDVATADDPDPGRARRPPITRARAAGEPARRRGSSRLCRVAVDGGPRRRGRTRR